MSFEKDRKFISITRSSASIIISLHSVAFQCAASDAVSGPECRRSPWLLLHNSLLLDPFSYPLTSSCICFNGGVWYRVGKN